MVNRYHTHAALRLIRTRYTNILKSYGLGKGGSGADHPERIREERKPAGKRVTPHGRYIHEIYGGHGGSSVRPHAFPVSSPAGHGIHLRHSGWNEGRPGRAGALFLGIVHRNGASALHAEEQLEVGGQDFHHRPCPRCSLPAHSTQLVLPWRSARDGILPGDHSLRAAPGACEPPRAPDIEDQVKPFHKLLAWLPIIRPDKRQRFAHSPEDWM